MHLCSDLTTVTRDTRQTHVTLASAAFTGDLGGSTRVDREELGKAAEDNRAQTRRLLKVPL